MFVLLENGGLAPWVVGYEWLVEILMIYLFVGECYKLADCNLLLCDTIACQYIMPGVSWIYSPQID